MALLLQGYLALNKQCFHALPVQGGRGLVLLLHASFRARRAAFWLVRRNELPTLGNGAALMLLTPPFPTTCLKYFFYI